MRNKLVLLLFGIVSIFSLAQKHTSTQMKNKEKLAVYQVFTRLFGNTNTNNKPKKEKETNNEENFQTFLIKL